MLDFFTYLGWESLDYSNPMYKRSQKIDFQGILPIKVPLPGNFPVCDGKLHRYDLNALNFGAL